MEKWSHHWIAAGQERLQISKFHNSVGGSNSETEPKATAHLEIKNLTARISSGDRIYITFKAEAFTTDLGDTALIEYLKDRITPDAI